MPCDLQYITWRRVGIDGRQSRPGTPDLANISTDVASRGERLFGLYHGFGA